MIIIGYLSYGYPSIEYSLEMADLYQKAGCDMIEVSIPSKDPYLDTEFISERMSDALKECDDYEVYLKELSSFISKHPELPIVFVIYEETIREIGVERLVQYMKENDIGDLIYAGRINYPEVKDYMINQGIRISCPVTHLMLDEEVDAAINSNGFVYMEGRPQNGTKPGFETLDKCISYLRQKGISRPIYCGVGIRSVPDVIYARESGGDGVFIGSALIRQYGVPEQMMETIRSFKEAAVE